MFRIPIKHFHKVDVIIKWQGPFVSSLLFMLFSKGHPPQSFNIISAAELCIACRNRVCSCLLSALKAVAKFDLIRNHGSHKTDALEPPSGQW